MTVLEMPTKPNLAPCLTRLGSAADFVRTGMGGPFLAISITVMVGRGKSGVSESEVSENASANARRQIAEALIFANRLLDYLVGGYYAAGANDQPIDDPTGTGRTTAWAPQGGDADSRYWFCIFGLCCWVDTVPVFARYEPVHMIDGRSRQKQDYVSVIFAAC